MSGAARFRVAAGRAVLIGGRVFTSGEPVPNDLPSLNKLLADGVIEKIS